jgi:hypothetical protein
MPVVLKSGSLNLLEPSGPVMGLLYLYLYLGCVLTMTMLLVVVCYKLRSLSQVVNGENQLHELAGKVSQLQEQTEKLARNGTVLSLQDGNTSKPSPDTHEYPDATPHSQPQTGQYCSLMCNVLLRFWGHALVQWLRHCATNQKVTGSFPDGVIGIFH